MIGSGPPSFDSARTAALLAGSPDALLLVDPAGTITSANDAADAMFGFDGDGPGDLVGRSIEELVPSEHRVGHATHRKSYSQSSIRRPMGTGLRLLGRHRSGEVFPVEIALSPVVIDDVDHTVAAVRDVTDRDVARARLLLHEERERIAHELHELVIQRLFGAGMALQSVTDLIDSAIARDRVVAVTDELDDTIRAVRAAIFSIGRHDVHHSLESQLRAIVEERSRHLGFTPELYISGALDDLQDYIADQLVATLTEAVNNIARHADATHVTVSVRRENHSVGLVIRDDGRGIGDKPKPLGGLSSVMWRAAELGGACSVSPVEPTGTQLRWQVPV